MPMQSVTTLTITCDNPNCPGHPELDPGVRDGWTFATVEVYGEPVGQKVFGDAACCAAFSALVAASDADWATKPAPAEEI